MIQYLLVILMPLILTGSTFQLHRFFRHFEIASMHKTFNKLYLNQQIHGNILHHVFTTNTDRLQNLPITDISASIFKPDQHIIQLRVLSKSSLRYAKTSGSVYNYAMGHYSGTDFYLIEMHFNKDSFNTQYTYE